MIILAVGQDEALLVSRAAVLCKTNAEVMRAGPTDALGLLQQKRFDLVVLCHTLAMQQSVDLCSTAHGGGIRVVQVLPRVSSSQNYESIAADILADADPERLVNQVADLLRLAGASGFPNLGRTLPQPKIGDYSD
jgi:hypothetical protein